MDVLSPAVLKRKNSMFTITDICNIAIQIERNGEMAYRSAALKSPDPQLAHMLNWMADEEVRHAQWFESMQPAAKASGEYDELETMGRSLLQEMMKNQTFSLDENRLTELDDIVHLLTRCVEFEQDTILFYEMLRSFVDETEVVEQLDAIIAQEHGHVDQLERLKGIYLGT
jgi:rubrerythrin